MNHRHLRLSPDRPQPLFASLTLWERCLMGTTILWVTFGTPYILWSLWVLR